MFSVLRLILPGATPISIIPLEMDNALFAGAEELPSHRAFWERRDTFGLGDAGLGNSKIYVYGF